MGKVTKMNTRAFVSFAKCSLRPVFFPYLFFFGDILNSMTHRNVPCPSARERTSCSWLCYGEEQAPAAQLDTRTLAIMVLGSEITLSVLPVLLILVFFLGMGQPYTSLGRLLILRFPCKISS